MYLANGAQLTSHPFADTCEFLGLELPKESGPVSVPLKTGKNLT